LINFGLKPCTLPPLISFPLLNVEKDFQVNIKLSSLTIHYILQAPLAKIMKTQTKLDFRNLLVSKFDGPQEGRKYHSHD